jgi:hypothetical protein
MQGQAFLGAQKAKTPRKYVFAARDRMDTEYDRVRMVRDKRYRYLYNYMPEKPYYQNIEYRLSIPMMREFLMLRDEGKLDSAQMAWFKTKPVEELYDEQTDPHELHNLANDVLYKDKLAELRGAFKAWTKAVGDMGNMAEKDMIAQMWGGKSEPPATDTPVTIKTPAGVKLVCKTGGASIGYRIIKRGAATAPEQHTIRTWDYGLAFGTAKNGSKTAAAPVWQVYKGEAITLQKGDTLKINAMRIGYKPAIKDYVE